MTILTLVLFMSASLFAQPPGGGQGGPPPIPTDKEVISIVEELNATLEVSEETGEDILGIYQSHFEVVREKVSGSARPDRDEMQALDAKLVTDVEALLTDAEKKKYSAFIKAQKKNKPKR